MLNFTKGDLFSSEAEALVNAVNTVGVMGKGIALRFKETFPQNFKAYKKACTNKELRPGKLLAVWDANPATGKKLIINFPTKEHWRSPSQYDYVEQGLTELARYIETTGVQSVALPAIGCGLGGLDWSKVKQLIIQHLEKLNAAIVVYEP